MTELERAAAGKFIGETLGKLVGSFLATALKVVYVIAVARWMGVDI